MRPPRTIPLSISVSRIIRDALSMVLAAVASSVRLQDVGAFWEKFELMHLFNDATPEETGPRVSADSYRRWSNQNQWVE